MAIPKTVSLKNYRIFYVNHDVNPREGMRALPLESDMGAPRLRRVGVAKLRRVEECWKKPGISKYF